MIRELLRTGNGNFFMLLLLRLIIRKTSSPFAWIGFRCIYIDYIIIYLIREFSSQS